MDNWKELGVELALLLGNLEKGGRSEVEGVNHYMLTVERIAHPELRITVGWRIVLMF